MGLDVAATCIGSVSVAAGHTTGFDEKVAHASHVYHGECRYGVRCLRPGCRFHHSHGQSPAVMEYHEFEAWRRSRCASTGLASLATQPSLVPDDLRPSMEAMRSRLENVSNSVHTVQCYVYGVEDKVEAFASGNAAVDGRTQELQQNLAKLEDKVADSVSSKSGFEVRIQEILQKLDRLESRLEKLTDSLVVYVDGCLQRLQSQLVEGYLNKKNAKQEEGVHGDGVQSLASTNSKGIKVRCPEGHVMGPCQPLQNKDPNFFAECRKCRREVELGQMCHKCSGCHDYDVVCQPCFRQL